MRKLILNLALSLDGYIEGKKGEYDWCFTDQDYGMKAFLDRIDTIFFGRKSYETLISVENESYPDKKKYVFSNSLQTLANGYTLMSGNLEQKVKQMKAEEGKNIWLFGGANLTTSLINLGLVDELQLSIHPILLGDGKPLFKNLNKRMNLHLLDVKKYSTGLAQHFYEFK
jgi:dihydrofolate reductase